MITFESSNSPFPAHLLSTDWPSVKICLLRSAVDDHLSFTLLVVFLHAFNILRAKTSSGPEKIESWIFLSFRFSYLLCREKWKQVCWRQINEHARKSIELWMHARAFASYCANFLASFQATPTGQKQRKWMYMFIQVALLVSSWPAIKLNFKTPKEAYCQSKHCFQQAYFVFRIPFHLRIDIPPILLFLFPPKVPNNSLK